MLIGVPKEVKRDEYRVAMLPVGVEELMAAGHTVLMEAGAGLGSGISDQEYAEQGAHIIARADEMWAKADLLVKVKVPLPQGAPVFRCGRVLTVGPVCFPGRRARASSRASPSCCARRRRLDSRIGLWPTS